MTNKTSSGSVYDITIRMLILLLIVVWCLLIMLPFVHILLWGLIFGISFLPMHNSLSKRIGDRPKLAASIIVVACLSIIIVPSLFFLDLIVNNIKEFREAYQAGTLIIPPPTEKVKSWPIIGNKIYLIWSSGTPGLEKFVIEYKDQLLGIGRKLASGLLGATSGMLQIVAAIIIAGVLLVVKGSGESIRKFFRKVAGRRGDHFADVVKMTIGNVLKGVLGVALIQAFLAGVGFALADIPFAGILTMMVLIFAILQISPTLIMIPVVIYMFSVKEPLPAILWSVFFIATGISDNVLKPVLLGKGAPVPTLIIFIGVVGGFIFSGFIGLFTGAIIMSIGYKLYIGWVNSADEHKVEEVSE